MQTANVKHAADELKEDLIKFTRKLLQTPSMSGQEAEVCKLSVVEMEKLGFDQAFIDGAGNAIGIVKGQNPEAPVIALNSHLDHVDPGEPKPYVDHLSTERSPGRKSHWRVRLRSASRYLSRKQGLSCLHPLWQRAD